MFFFKITLLYKQTQQTTTKIYSGYLPTDGRTEACVRKVIHINSTTFDALINCKHHIKKPKFKDVLYFNTIETY